MPGSESEAAPRRSRGRSRLLLAASSAAAAAVAHGGLSFVGPPRVGAPASAAPAAALDAARLAADAMPRGQWAQSSSTATFAGSSTAPSWLAAAAGLAAGLAAAAATARHAGGKPKKKKQKGVRIVHGREIPWMIHGPKAPYKAKVVANHVQPQTLTKPTGDPNWETAHITLDHGGNMPYLEGQSIGVIAPGPDKKGETPAKVRLYSIASSAVGDDEHSNTVSLCVKRLVEVEGKHVNREVGEDKPDRAGTAYPEKRVYRGVSSNYVCDLQPGDEVLITGPTGAEMLLPEDPDANIIMLATGTGIAPMRSYCRLLFNDEAGANPDGSRKFRGLAWLFLGVPYTNSILYDEEHQDYKAKYPNNFRYDYAVSREQKNDKGQKMYIQTKLAEYADELWDMLQKPNTHLYICGLKGMETGIEECFGPLAAKNGVDWKEFVKEMKKADRYHMEVY